MSVYKKDIDNYQNILDKIRNGFDTLVFNTVEKRYAGKSFGKKD